MSPIACLSCRQGKQKCSWPTNNLQTCQRCTSKGQECQKVERKARKRRRDVAYKDRIENAISRILDKLDGEPLTNPSPTVRATTTTDLGIHFSDPLSFLAQTSSEVQSGARLLPTKSLEWREYNRQTAYRTYFAPGITLPRLDKGVHHPISTGLVDETTAKDLFDYFMEYMNGKSVALDPVLYTFQRVNDSVLLLSVICSLAGRFVIKVDRGRLDKHVAEVILPHIFSKDLRSVEIAQALLLLATYHEPTATIAEDRTWSFLGHAIRIAGELDMNADYRPSSSLSEWKNHQRTYMKIEHEEHFFSCFYGKKPLLSATESSSRDYFASIKGSDTSDAALLSRMELRSLQVRSTELLHKLRPGTIGFYLPYVEREFEAWYARKEQVPQGWHERLVCLHYHYARIMAIMLVFRHAKASNLNLAVMYSDVADHASRFMHILATTKGLMHSPNTIFVLGAFVGVVALKLSQHQELKQGVKRMTTAFYQAANGRPCCPRSYAEFLDAISNKDKDEDEQTLLPGPLGGGYIDPTLMIDPFQSEDLLSWAQSFLLA